MLKAIGRPATFSLFLYGICFWAVGQAPDRVHGREYVHERDIETGIISAQLSALARRVGRRLPLEPFTWSRPLYSRPGRKTR